MDNRTKYLLATGAFAIFVAAVFTSTSSPRNLDLLNNDNLPVVQIHAYDFDEYNRTLSYLGSGSGSIISDQNHILTNFHVISDYWYTDPVDVFEICATVKVSEESFCNYTASLVDFDADNDIAILKMDNTDIYNKPLPDSFKKIAMNFEQVPVGQEIYILGYPGIGGDTMTFTNGRTSGYTTNSDGLWVKTDTKIDSGNSGGAVVDNNLNLIGVPTFTITDTETIAYFKPLSDVQEQIEKALKKKPQNNVPAKTELRRVMKINLEAHTADTYENEYPNYSIELEDDWHFDYIDLTTDNTVYIENENDIYDIIITSSFFPYNISVEDYLKWFQLYNADSKFTDYYFESDLLVDGRKTYEYEFSGYPQIGRGYLFTAGNYAFDIYIIADQEESLAFDYDDFYAKTSELDDMIESFRILQEPNYSAPSSFEHTNTNFSISTIDAWHITTYNSDPDAIDIYRENSVALVSVLNYWMSDDAWISPEQDLENYVTGYYYTADDLEILENNHFSSLAGFPAHKMLFEYQVGRNRYKEVIYRYIDWENERTLDISYNNLVGEFDAYLPEFEQILNSIVIEQ